MSVLTELKPWTPPPTTTTPPRTEYMSPMWRDNKYNTYNGYDHDSYGDTSHISGN